VAAVPVRRWSGGAANATTAAQPAVPAIPGVPSAPRNCYSIKAVSFNAWCASSCALNNCPEDMCKCDSDDKLDAPSAVSTAVAVVPDAAPVTKPMMVAKASKATATAAKATRETKEAKETVPKAAPAMVAKAAPAVAAKAAPTVVAKAAPTVAGKATKETVVKAAPVAVAKAAPTVDSAKVEKVPTVKAPVHKPAHRLDDGHGHQPKNTVLDFLGVPKKDEDVQKEEEESLGTPKMSLLDSFLGTATALQP